ncbi:efflux RND transporter periplasmic adaptor subunit [Haloferula sp.]|uniref:efflux RND transporter periplasmic adaptor subunit n=1 Tax=Haloferula sp. TaxID=2497595 RepID=UPI00329F5D5A
MKTSLFIALSLVAFSSCKKNKNTFVQPPAPSVTVAHPDVREVTTYKEAPGTVEGLSEVDIRARVRGFLEEIHFKEGEWVEKGDKLFLIEQAPYEAQLAAAQANLDNAEAAHKLAVTSLQRLKRANSRSSGAVSELDVDVGQAEVDQAAAVVSQMTALYNDAKIELSYTIIFAPTAGRMSRSLVDIGNLVDGSEGTLLGHITDDSKVRVYFEAPERGMIHFLEKRAADGGVETDKLSKVNLTLADGTLHDHPGVIDFVDSRVDPGTRTATIRSVFPNPDGKLASGLYALVGYPEIFPNSEHPNSVLVPAVSILRDLAGDYVWAIDEKNVVFRRGVVTGTTVPRPNKDDNAAPARDMIVLKGLTKEDRVVVAGLQRAREGAPVNPQMEGEQAPPSKPPGN